MRPTTVVNQPPISSIIPDNSSTSDPEHKLARVLHAARQPKPTFNLLQSLTHQLSKQQHCERLQAFLTRRSDAAKRCTEAALGTPYPEGHASTPEVAPRIKYRAARHTCDVTRSKESTNNWDRHVGCGKEQTTVPRFSGAYPHSPDGEADNALFKNIALGVQVSCFGHHRKVRCWLTI
jgi:hypothetical protein